jgi:hypothetical protein
MRLDNGIFVKIFVLKALMFQRVFLKLQIGMPRTTEWRFQNKGRLEVGFVLQHIVNNLQAHSSRIE